MRVKITLILFAISQALHAQSERQVIPALAPLPAPAAAAVEVSVVRAFWEGAPAQMAAGDNAVLTLRVTAPGAVRLPAEFFMPEVPPGAILAPLPISAQEMAGGGAAKFSLIPLDGDFHLPAHTYQYENIRLEIPSLHIRVRGRAAKAPPQTSAQSGAALSVTQAQFPELPDAAAGKNHSQFEIIYNTARDLWNEGFRAQALAELRRNEKDHSTGALLAQTRREAEESLGIFNTENESRLRRKLFFGLSVFFIHIVIISIVVCFALVRVSGPKKQAWRRAAVLCAVVSAAMTMFCFLSAGSAGGGGAKSRFAVTEETGVFRAPEPDGEELFRFSEGQPVVIMLNSGSWLYVRANDASGGLGWIPADAAILY